MQHLSKDFLLTNGSNFDFDLNVLDYPEKVVQYGTVVLLKGLPDLIIDNANKKGVFCGRVVMVKSTNNGSIASLEKQNCLYTVGIQGIKKTN
jgi:tagaturonate reductase